RSAAEQRNGREVLDRVVRELADRLVHGMRDRREQQRVAVRRRPRRNLRADDAARAAAIVHDQLLSDAAREPRADEPRDDVVAATGGKSDDEPDRAVRIGLYRRGASALRAGK